MRQLNAGLKYVLLLMILFVGIYTDQGSKKWAAQNLKNKPVMVVVKNALEFGYTENRGMVFGINNRNSNAFIKNILPIIRIILSIVLSIVLLLNLKKKFLFHLPFVLILSGAIGNVIDSLRSGYVIDFIHMHAGKWLDWPFLFNLADFYVCVGMGILILQNYLTGNATKKDLQKKDVVPSNEQLL